MKANSYTYAKDLSKVTAISAVHFPLRHKENGCIYIYIYGHELDQAGQMVDIGSQIGIHISFLILSKKIIL